MSDNSRYISPLDAICETHDAPRSLLDSLIETEPSALESIHSIDVESHRKQALSWFEIRAIQQTIITYERTRAALAAMPIPDPARLPRLKTCSIGPFSQGFCTQCGLRERGRHNA